MYLLENYKDCIRFNEQYEEISRFLQINADAGDNEHFHWGRFAWMMQHPYLDPEMLPQIALFRNKNGELVGAVLFDTSFQDRWYLLHSISDEALLTQMIAYVLKTDAGTAAIKANLKDTALCGLLTSAGFDMQGSESILEIDLSHDLSFQLPLGFCLNAPDAEIDNKQWQMVIHRGFDHEGLPDEPSKEVAKAQKHLETPEYIKTFAILNDEYAACCGVWYSGGETAYIEPVATIPEHRGKGLGRAVVYEALSRAKERGAKRAIVISEQEFYTRLGMTKSSEVGTWVKNG